MIISVIGNLLAHCLALNHDCASKRIERLKSMWQCFEAYNFKNQQLHTNNLLQRVGATAFRVHLPPVSSGLDPSGCMLSDSG